jgi:hypothetical protein
VPRIVLPITSRGIVVSDRVCWWLLGVAMAVAAGLILYLNRGTTFFLDELAWVYDSPNLSGAGDVLEPHNGHLIATSRLVYKAILEVFGAEYVVFRVVAVLTVVLSAGVFYALVKRRIGALPALAPALVLLFLGSAWQHVVIPVGFTVIFSIAAGLAALLALERDDRRGDVAACALLVLSVATYTTGLAFLVGVAISVLIRGDRRRRAWIFLVPLVLYAAWWVWALGSAASAEDEAHPSNILVIPNYVAESLATTLAAIVGLDYDFSELSPPAAELGWGRVLAVLAVIAFAFRLRRGAVPRALWVSLGIVLAYWTLGALAASGERGPGATRYVYPGVVAVLLVAVDAVRPLRVSRLGLLALFAAAAFSVATNLAILRNGVVYFRDDYSAAVRSELAMLELARANVAPDFNPANRLPPEIAPVGAPATTYLGARDRYGSPAFSLGELSEQTEGVREGADQVLATALGLRLEPSPPGERGRACRRLRSAAPGGTVRLPVPPGGASLRVAAVAPASVSVGSAVSPPPR